MKITILPLAALLLGTSALAAPSQNANQYDDEFCELARARNMPQAIEKYCGPGTFNDEICANVRQSGNMEGIQKFCPPHEVCKVAWATAQHYCKSMPHKRQESKTLDGLQAYQAEHEALVAKFEADQQALDDKYMALSKL